jgi:hypothetical protein
MLTNTTVEITEELEVAVAICGTCSVRYTVLQGRLETCMDCGRPLVRGGLSGRIERVPS